MLSLKKRIDNIEPMVMAQAGQLEKAVYGVVDKINDNGSPNFVRRWKGTIGNMEPTEDTPTIYIIEKLEPAILKHKKYKCFFGGRAGTKSIMAMDAMIGDVNSCGSRVYVLRERMKSLKESIYAGIEGRVKVLDFAGFTPVPSNWEIRHKTGGLFTFGGMQNIIDMKGSFNYKYFLMEEAAKTKQETIDILGPTLRGVEGAELWYIWNNESANDPMSKEFILPYQEDIDRYGYYEDDYHLIIKVGFEDNPWFMYDDALRTEYMKDKEKMEDGRMSKARFYHIWHGHFNDDIEDSLIETDWFDACVDAHEKLGFKPKGAIVATFDPSDVGSDAKGYVLRHGNVFVEADEIDADNANTACDIACGKAISANADVFGWDCDGLGAPLRRQVSDNFANKNIRSFMFKGSESPHNQEQIFQGGEEYGIKDGKKIKDVVANKKSQNYLLLAEKVRTTYEVIKARERGEMMYVDPDMLVSFSSKIAKLQKLRSELCRMPLKPNGRGMILLYTKPEMRAGITMPGGQRIVIPSPNMGDCCMMSYDKSGTIVNKVKPRMPKPLPVMGRK